MTVLGLGERDKGLDDIAAGLAELAAQFDVADAEGSALVDALVARRNAAREERDWATGDAIRDGLAALGVIVEDGAAGSVWHRR